MDYLLRLKGERAAGKTTLIRGLKEAIETLGYQVLITREPGGTPLGEEVREMLLAKSEKLKVGALAELFLFLASRSQHLEEVIRPALNEGLIVICDRFNDSTVAYQGRARGLGVEKVRGMTTIACDGLLPDFTVLLDIDPLVGLERSKSTHKKESAAGAHDRIESEELQFHVNVREALLEEAKRRAPNAIIIDASSSKEEALNYALKELDGLFFSHHRQ